MSKPEVQISNWYLLENRLYGDAKGHPILGDGFVRTSSVLSVDLEAGIVETRNTIYRLIGDSTADEKVQISDEKKQSIARVKSLAADARKQYHEDLAAGGEPKYPEWIDDVLAVCELAESARNQGG